MAIIQANLRRNIPGQIGQGITAGTNGFFAGREAQQSYRHREDENTRAGQDAARQNLAAALSIVQQLSPQARRPAMQQIAQNAERRGEGSILTELIGSGDPMIPLQDTQAQLAGEAAEMLPSQSRAEVGLQQIMGDIGGSITPAMQQKNRIALTEIAQNTLDREPQEVNAIAQLQAAGIQNPTPMQIERQIVDNLAAVAAISNSGTDLSSYFNERSPESPGSPNRLGQSLIGDAQRPKPTTGQDATPKETRKVPNELPEQLSDDQVTFAQERLATHIEEGFSPEEAVDLARFELIEYIRKQESDAKSDSNSLNRRPRMTDALSLGGRT